MPIKIGIDVGGTFTDFFVVDEHGRSRSFKVLSTPDSPADAVVQGLGKAASALGLTREKFLRDVSLIVHGTTITTNAVLTRRTARTGFLTTEGFRDLLHMRRGIRETYYDSKIDPPTPLVPRALIAPIRERIDRDGAVATPLDERAVREALELFRRSGVEAIAISFLFSFLNPLHEHRVRDLCAAVMPGSYLSVSSEILPQVRAYERHSTVVLNAAVGPLLSAYLDNLVARLAEHGFGGELRIMQSNGGVVTPEASRRLAVQTLLSGPAAGPIAGLYCGRRLGLEQLITVDMGGTSFDVALVRGGALSLTSDGELGGYRIATQSLDIHSVGAGGGSIAWVDGAGVLKVGPRSAGARPGPVCYGFGGDQPTVTDADLVLGYLNPDRFFGGELALDAERARDAIHRHVARPLGLGVVEAAWGIYSVVNATMANAMRVLSVRRGHDPREFALVAAGGAGPLHAERLARELGISLILVPKESAVFCGAGMLVADLKHQFVRSLPCPLQETDLLRLNEVLSAMRAEGMATLRKEGVPAAQTQFTAAFELRYAGQFNEIEIELPYDGAPLAPADRERLHAAFHERHDALFGYRLPREAVELITLRLTALGMTEKPLFEKLPWAGPDPAPALIERREAYFDGGFVSSAVYDGLRLGYGNRVAGPAVVELPTTAIVMSPVWEAEVDEVGNFMLFPREETLDELLARLRGGAR